MPLHLAAAVLLPLGAVPAGAWAAAPTDAERARLNRSLATACQQFSSDAQWRELDACHLAWFKANEEAVWRLKLNPHGSVTEVPSD